jgi:hypothetical protein
MADFKLERGTVVQTVLVSSFLVEAARNAARTKWEEEHGKPEPPTYTVPLAGGGHETYPYDAEAIKEADTEEEVKAWHVYLAKKAILDDILWRTSVKVWLCEGVIGDPPEEWEEQQKRWGISIPTDPMEKKVHWIQTGLVSGLAELLSLVVHVQTQQDPVEVAAQVAADTFQR